MFPKVEFYQIILKSSLGAGGPLEEWADSLAVWCGSGEPGDDNDNNENDEPINDKHNDEPINP